MKDRFDKVEQEIENMNEATKQIALNLLDKAIFMETEMCKLQDILATKGWTEEYHNGANQYGLKKSSEGNVYIALTKNYTNTMKLLRDILGKNATESTDDLMSFLKR